MRLADLPLFSSRVIIVRAAGVGTKSLLWEAKKEVSFWRDGNEYWLKQGDQLIEVEPQNLGKEAEQLLQRRELLWLLLTQRSDQFQLQYAEPADWVHLDESLEIGVDRVITENLTRNGILNKADINDAVRWFQDEFVVGGNPQRAAVLRRNSDVSADWHLIGLTWRADLEQQGSGSIQVRRIARAESDNDSWSLVIGDIAFVDSSVGAKLLSEAERAKLARSLESNGDYLKLWQRYGEEEWQRRLRLAASLGALAYHSCEEGNDEGGSWRFKVDPDSLGDFKRAWFEMETDSSLGLEAGANQPQWADEHHQDLSRKASGRRFRGRPFFQKNAILIESRLSAPPDEGYLYLSLAGDRTVQERRFKARQDIEKASRLPELRYVLQGLPVDPDRSESYPSLTQNALDCFKTGRPTDKQREAIRVAMETPDVALIIGPPGTGKTQVIAALSRMLADIGGTTGPQHQILISSFQHDAVENVLERTEVFGLPSVKEGGKKNNDGVDPIERWCEQQHMKLTQAFADNDAKEGHVALLMGLHRSIATLRHAQLEYAERLSLLRRLDGVLHQLGDQYLIRLPTMLKNEWDVYLADLPASNTSNVLDSHELFLRKVRGLRITPAGFSDDGRDRALDALLFLESISDRIASEDLDLLRMFSKLEEMDSQRAAEAALLKDRLIDTLLPDYRPPAAKNRLEEGGLLLIGRIEAALDTKLKETRYGEAAVLARYRDAFVNHPDRTRMAVREYAMVVGATCQQAGSQQMASLKALSGIDSTGIEFNTVIIDEAARANPLDLFIPMSMARRRVILVGDHLQLPHILDPDIENLLVEQMSLSELEKKAYEQSLFERLLLQLVAHEEGGGRQRVVMLDRQFRMHPILGKFISENFYQPAGLGVLHSGLDESDFRCDVPGYKDKVCAWIDVPLSLGNEDKVRSSRKRLVEADRVTEEVDRLLMSCDPERSIGVITFYAAQRDEILENLSAKGITERNAESGNWTVAEKWRKTSNGTERLRIGTVDAFQGKEFDIVLLSVVRANSRRIPEVEIDSEHYERAANGKYGHLRLTNRLNVAMSRQRLLLIVVGDKAMYQGKSAQAAVPALVAFVDLCKEHNSVL
jgi:hypothetical protein